MHDPQQGCAARSLEICLPADWISGLGWAETVDSDDIARIANEKAPVRLFGHTDQSGYRWLGDKPY
jgi:hypothetical protein